MSLKIGDSVKVKEWTLCPDIEDFLVIYPNFTEGDAPFVEIEDGFIGRDGLDNVRGDVGATTLKRNR